MTKDRTSFSDNTRPIQAPSNGNHRSSGNSNGNSALRQRRPRSQQGKQVKERGSPEKAKNEAKEGIPEARKQVKKEATSEATTPVRGGLKPDFKHPHSASKGSKPADNKFSGSSFYSSPNAASLPRPPFSKPASPPHAQMQPTPSTITPPRPMAYPQPYMAYPPAMQHPFNRGPMMFPPGPMGYPMGPPNTMAVPMPGPVGPIPMYGPPLVAMNMQQPSAN